MTSLKTQYNQWYWNNENSRYCCDEFQPVFYCIAHDEPQGCYYCEFDYDQPCQCEA